MGKEYNLGVAEYAYVKSFNVVLNQKATNKGVTTYTTNFVIKYDVLDAKKAFLLSRDILHTVSQPTKLFTVADVKTILDTNFEMWVRTDKQTLSGYVPPTK